MARLAYVSPRRSRGPAACNHTRLAVSCRLGAAEGPISNPRPMPSLTVDGTPVLVLPARWTPYLVPPLERLELSLTRADAEGKLAPEYKGLLDALHDIRRAADNYNRQSVRSQTAPRHGDLRERGEVDANEAAKIAKCSVRTIHRWCTAGKLRHRRVAGRIVIPRTAAEDILTRKRLLQ